MGLRIATNMASLGAQRALSKTNWDTSKVYERLASGQRIVRAGDDAAGLSISEHLRGQLRSIGQAERNANDGISFIQVAEGGLSELSNAIVRMRELAIQAGSDTVGDKERVLINTEVQALTQEIDRIAHATNFNGTKLLDGEAEQGVLKFQVGIDNEDSNRLEFDANAVNVTTAALGLDGLDYTERTSALDALGTVDEALDRVFTARSGLGAAQNKMQTTVQTLAINKENLAQARSRIADADLASETADLVRNNIMQSAGISVLAQANQAPTQALKLL